MARQHIAHRASHIARGLRGFTLVEILIVVVILGILAALVVPQFSNAARLSRENTMREDLRYMRTQILIYNAQHNSTPPGYAAGSTTATAEAFVAQLTGFTDVKGNVSAASTGTYRFGPYLKWVPGNPINDLDTIRIIGPGTFPTVAAGTHGWIYQPSSLTFATDAVGNDDLDKPYIEY